MLGHSPDHVVTGLDQFAASERPPVLLTHSAFQIMVACGFALIGVGLWFWYVLRRRREESAWLLRVVLLAAPLGFLALEAGWIVSEVGRQPWVIYGVMRTADGVTPRADVPATLFGFTVLYLLLGMALAALLRGLARHRTRPGPERSHVA
jgi:cytochrome d ubiquinol oxidase subunit I